MNVLAEQGNRTRQLCTVFCRWPVTDFTAACETCASTTRFRSSSRTITPCRSATDAWRHLANFTESHDSQQPTLSYHQQTAKHPARNYVYCCYRRIDHTYRAHAEQSHTVRRGFVFSEVYIKSHCTEWQSDMDQLQRTCTYSTIVINWLQ